MSFFPLIPFRPPAGSSGFTVTRSILDMMFIHGISRLTIADIADNTPLESDLDIAFSQLYCKTERT